MAPVDLRSDTVTLPTAAMYDAMRAAPLGDDVLGDDPTVARLEVRAAEVLGKAGALFVPSGTMGNQIGIAAQVRPGDAIIVEEEAHVLYYEVGGSAMHAQAVSWTLPSEFGTPAIEAIEARILKRDLHRPGTALICLENSHNRKGGTVTSAAEHQAIRDMADRHEVRLHLDGARIWNASVALGESPAQLAAPFHTVSACLSKGLGCPIGSVVAGDGAFIDHARIWRKRLGGGMRQAGILAACGLVALDTMIDRLADDHARARRVAVAISELPGIRVDLNRTHTNLVMVHTESPAEDWAAALERADVRCFPTSARTLRLVFHLNVDDEAAERAIAAFQAVAVSHR